MKSDRYKSNRINSSKVYCKSSIKATSSSILWCINSSKVYCKWVTGLGNVAGMLGINSSKVYCKCLSTTFLLNCY